jgi:hypothetical protein
MPRNFLLSDAARAKPQGTPHAVNKIYGKIGSTTAPQARQFAFVHVNSQMEQPFNKELQRFHSLCVSHSHYFLRLACLLQLKHNTLHEHYHRHRN